MELSPLYEQLSPDIRGNESITTAIKDLPKLDNLVTAFVEKNKEVDKYKQEADSLRTKTFVPEDSDPPEAWQKMYDKLGVVKDFKELGIQFEEGKIDKDFFDFFVKKAVETKMTSKQVKQWYESYKEFLGTRKTSTESQLASQRAEAEAALREAWKEDYSVKLEQARRAIERYVPEDAKKDEVIDKYGNDPFIMKIFADVGQIFTDLRILDVKAGTSQTKMKPGQFYYPSLDKKE